MRRVATKCFHAQNRRVTEGTSRIIIGSLKMKQSKTLSGIRLFKQQDSKALRKQSA
jgi:hypothetical protein